MCRQKQNKQKKPTLVVCSYTTFVVTLQMLKVQCTIHLRILKNSFFLNTYILAIVLDAQDPLVNKTKVPALVELPFQQRKAKIYQIILYFIWEKKGRSGIMGLGQYTISNRVLEEGAFIEKVRSEQNLKAGNLAKWSSEQKEKQRR